MTDDNNLFPIRMEDGATIPAAIEREAKDRKLDFVDITGFGRLHWIEFGDPDQEQEIVRLEGPLDLLHLAGRARIVADRCIADYVCTVSRNTDNGIQVLGGRLAGALVQFLELSITDLAGTPPITGSPRGTIEPVRPDRPASSRSSVSSARPTGISGPVKPMKPQKAPSVADRWATVIAESSRVEDEGPFGGGEDDEMLPRRGEIVNHLQFGPCKVVKVGDDHISLRKPDGRIVQLGLSILKFEPVGLRDGVQVYDAKIQR